MERQEKQTVGPSWMMRAESAGNAGERAQTRALLLRYPACVTWRNSTPSIRLDVLSMRRWGGGRQALAHRSS